MGYRSDVHYVVFFRNKKNPEKAYAEFLSFHDWVKQHSTTTPELHFSRPTVTYEDVLKDGRGDGFYWSVKDLCLVFRAGSIKWYPNYPEIMWHEQLLKKVSDYDSGGYEFARIGEDDMDNEVERHRPEESVDDLYEDEFFRVEIVRQIAWSTCMPEPSYFEEEVKS